MPPETMPDVPFSELAQYTLLDLTTFRVNGDAVTTPVRFALADGRVVVSLRSDSGKVKRATRDPNVLAAGHPRGPQHAARIRFLEGAEANAAANILRRRHPLLFVQRLILGRHPTRHVVAEPTLRPSAS